MSILKVDTINEKTSGNGVAIPGHVVQTVYNEHITRTAYTSANTAHDLFSAIITPKSATSKILVSISLQHGTSNVQNDFGLHLK